MVPRLDAHETYNAGAVVRLQLAEPRHGKGIAIGARTRSVSAFLLLSKLRYAQRRLVLFAGSNRR